MTDPHSRHIIVALTGASGIQYGVRLVEALAAQPGLVLTLMMSKAAWQVALAEVPGLPGADPRALFSLTEEQWGRVRLESPMNMAAPAASGSSITNAMAVCPCSMKTLAAIAHGYEDNLIARAAGCILKEGRRLVLVPRETPLHAVYLENMLALARLGARIVPAMPGFYHAPRTIADLLDFMTMKICDQLDVPLDSPHRWKGMSGKE
ncbi:MAG: flavin prenyltransferase UbiX [Candidatus Sumerlaeia bacterium]